ncbi:hypothetical protein MUO66_09930 [Candidatus Bathyarchaeota archaeon]|nr:hypothetical protein [Candidatus Bathyarchaeota archaeon]
MEINANLVGKRGSPKDIANFLQSLSFLEKQKSTLYNQLSEKIDILNFNDCFLKISQDTKKNSRNLDEIASKICQSKIGERDCSKRLAYAYYPIEKALEKIKHKKILSIEEILEILSILECSFGEESYMVIQAKTFLAMAPQMCSLYGVHLEDFQKVFYDILVDEEVHLELFEIIKAIIEKKLHKSEGSSPVVRYRNPDAWIAAG